MMSNRLNLYAERTRRLATGIADLEDGAPSVVIDGVTYGLSALDALYRLRDRFLLKAAIEAIESGAQSYTLLGRTFQKAQYAALVARLDRLEAQDHRAARGGIQTRHVVPLR